MEKYSNSRRPQGAQPAQKTAGRESFAEMANVTAGRPGLVGKLLVVSLIVVSVAITAFVGFAIFNGADNNEASRINKDQYQAVFLSDGQIYFGHLAEVNKEFAVLEDIYYLQVQQAVQPVEGEDAQSPAQSISLAKLGNELHCPEDQMFLNRSQVLFWENLRDSGQVANAIEGYLDGRDTDLPDCEVPAADTGANAPVGDDSTEPAN